MKMRERSASSYLYDLMQIEIPTPKLEFLSFMQNQRRPPMTTKKETIQPPKKTPNFYVHTTIPNGRNKKIGSRIGAIFNHNVGNGFTIILDAMPIAQDGRVELVAYAPQP